MDPGNTAHAMILVSVVALTAVVGLPTFIYSAYCFLVTVQDTAAGVDAVRWPGDPLYDKLPRAGYLAALLAICLAPAGLTLRLNPTLALDGSRLLTFLVAGTILLWGWFPFLLLSALSASSPWVVFRWTVLRFFLRRFGAIVVFYFVSATLAAGTLGVLYLTFSRRSILLTFVAPFLVAWAFLVYARLLGRIAYLFDQSPMRSRRRSSRNRTARESSGTGDDPGTARRSKKKTRPVEDPWEIPEEDVEERPKRKAERVAEYTVAPDDEGIPKQVQSSPARRVKGYRLANEEMPTRPAEMPQDGYVPVGYEAVAPRKGENQAPGPPESMSTDFEKRFRQKPDEPDPPPKLPLVSGVYSFPFYPTNIPVWALLSIGGIAMCGVVQALLALS